jgi:hypothetical protein
VGQEGGLSKARDNLLAVLKNLCGFELEMPLRGLSGKRLFRFDAALPERKLALKYQDIGRGHQRGSEQAKNHEKLTKAQLCGCLVIVCDIELVNNGK